MKPAEALDEVPAEELQRRLEITGLAGRGGFGVVWKGRCRRTGATIGAKVLERSAEAEQEATICRAAQHHAAIVPLLACWATDSHVCILLEFLEGATAVVPPPTRSRGASL